MHERAPTAACVDREVRYAVLLADADAHFVTADSVSMISEAIMTGKPVGLIAVEPGLARATQTWQSRSGEDEAARPAAFLVCGPGTRPRGHGR